MAHIWRQN